MTDTAEKNYNVIFTGKIVKGWDIGKVKKDLAGRFKIGRERMDALFNGGKVIVKKKIPPVNELPSEPMQKISSPHLDPKNKTLFTHKTGTDKTELS